jgi:hypothetical protein
MTSCEPEVTNFVVELSKVRGCEFVQQGDARNGNNILGSPRV